jgi:hypothetical protein
MCVIFISSTNTSMLLSITLYVKINIVHGRFIAQKKIILPTTTLLSKRNLMHVIFTSSKYKSTFPILTLQDEGNIMCYLFPSNTNKRMLLAKINITCAKFPSSIIQSIFRTTSLDSKEKYSACQISF